MHRVCRLEIKVVTSILPYFLRYFPFGPNLTSARNRNQMAPERVNCWLLHSVYPHFKPPLILQEEVRNESERCVGTNCSGAQEPSEFDF